jgi:predicted site-specific integrase-resolvase
LVDKVVVDLDNVVKMNDAAESIGISIATAWRWKREGKLVTINLAGRILVPKSEITRLRKNGHEVSP